MSDTTPAVNLPGRLGDPNMDIQSDPRSDPRMIATMVPLGLGENAPDSPVNGETPIEALLAYCDEAEPGFEMMSDILNADLPQVSNVERSVEVIRGLDDNDVTLYIHRPTDVDGPLPAMLHLHGGGMVILEASGAGYMRWRDELAATGMLIVGVEFRNGGGKQGPFPFPAGLHDCQAGLQWLHDRRDELGVSKIIVSGESGGGNLTLATTLKAKRDGRLDQIQGVYAQCPYISNAYSERDPNLPSLWENDGYFLDVENMGALARVYDPSGDNARNPLAWPMHAAPDDLAGLPPHVISVNELDPLRDEGLLYFRKLLAAGVPATSRTVNGTCHAGDCLFRGAMPDTYLSTIRDIKLFADSV